MTNAEMYAILADIVNYTDNDLSFFLKRKVKKQVLTNIDKCITMLCKRGEYLHLSGDDVRPKQIEEVLDLLVKFRNEVKYGKLQ